MTRRGRSLLRKAGLAWLLVAFSLLLSTSGVLAHSYFMESDPPDGSILERAPAKVTLVFSSAVATEFTSIQLVEAKGARYSPTSVRPSPGAPSVVVVELPQIPNGSYRLSFSTRDSVDLHETAGSIVFGVGEAPATTQKLAAPTPPKPSEFLLRWLALAGLSAILGGLVVALMVAGRLPVETAIRARVQRYLFGLALIGAVLVLVAETALLVVQASALGPVLTSIGRMLAGSEYGIRWLVTVLLVAGISPLLISLWVAAGRKEVPGLAWELRELGWWVLLTHQVRVLALCIGLTVVMAFSGHVAGASGTSVGGVTLLSLHVGAMGVWAGGVVALVIALLALRRATGKIQPKVAVTLAVGFGPIAAVSFATLGATGLLLSGMQVASITALLSTQYGVVLIAKVALIGVVGLFGVRHALLTWRGLGPRLPSRFRFPARLPLTIAMEAGGAIFVVLLAAVLGASAPAQGPQFAPPERGPTITQLTREQDGLLITVSVKPNRAGPNLVSVRLVNTRRPALAPVSKVTVMVQRPGDSPPYAILPTTASGSTYDIGSVELDAGDARFVVTVQRPALDDSVASVAWRVNALDVPRAQVVISNQALAPLVDIAAVLMLVVAASLIGAGIVRHRYAARLAARDAIASTRSHRRRGGPMNGFRYTSIEPPSRRRLGPGSHFGARGWLRRRTRQK